MWPIGGIFIKIFFFTSGSCFFNSVMYIKKQLDDIMAGANRVLNAKAVSSILL